MRIFKYHFRIGVFLPAKGLFVLRSVERSVLYETYDIGYKNLGTFILFLCCKLPTYLVNGLATKYSKIGRESRPLTWLQPGPTLYVTFDAL